MTFTISAGATFADGTRTATAVTVATGHAVAPATRAGTVPCCSPAWRRWSRGWRDAGGGGVARTGRGSPSASLRTRLGVDHPWFHDLFTPGAEPERTDRLPGSRTEVDGSPLWIEELSGRPGDVVLMHPRSLHAVAPNALRPPRLAELATHLYLSEGGHPTARRSHA